MMLCAKATLVVFFYIISCAAAWNAYYVTVVGSKEPCPVHATCHNISYYVDNSPRYFTNDTIFYFMRGTHVMEREVGVSKVSNITFTGMGEVERGFHETVSQTTTIIKCSGSATGLSITNSSDVALVGLTFVACGHQVIIVFEPFSSGYISNRVSLLFDNVHGLTISMVSVLNKTGIGLMTVNSLPVVISCSSFTHAINSDTTGENVLVIFDGYQAETESMPNHSFDFRQSNVSFGHALEEYGSGLQIFLHNVNMTNQIQFNIDKVILHNNSGVNGANLLFYVDSSCCYSLVVNNSIITDAVGKYAAVSIDHDTHHIEGISNISISNTELAHNDGGAISVYWRSNSVTVTLALSNCSIHDNLAYYNPAIIVYVYKQFDSCNSFVTEMKHVTFYNNKILNYNNELYNGGAVVFRNAILEIDNVTFLNHSLTGLLAFNSKITFSGDSYFTNNTGICGGGMSLHDTSIRLHNNTRLVFSQNRAIKEGGAIFVSDKLHDLPVASCFYRITSPAKNISLNFSGNTAHNGDVLYGSDTSVCKAFSEVFNYSMQTGSNLINSQAAKACLCENGRPNCNIIRSNITVAPGGSKTVSIAAVSISNSSTTGNIKISMYEGSSFHGHHVCNITNATCTDVTVANLTTITTTLLLTRENAYDPVLDTTAKNISVSYTKHCPLGFALDQTDHICTCDENLKKPQVQCNIVTKTITRSGNIWLGYWNRSNTGCSVIRTCPFSYCNESQVTLHDITDPDPQCAMNRSGFLCGNCSKGLSLRLGAGDACVSCTNNYLALLIPFAVAGVALVVVLIALNMTVSVGSINGLIFYANIVKLYQDIFFPNIVSVPFLRQFISWINLDWGFQTCFYDGLNACGKTWLQFVFPLYIWLLIGGIIWLASCRPRFSKLIGNSAVPVLATLILLSYNTLIQTVIKALYIGKVSCDKEARSTFVWLLDGNMSLASPCYTLLFIVSLLSLVLLILPYTLFLLFLPLIEGPLSKYIFFQKLNLKLKPFMDAYGGPYKDRYRFWPGLLLLMRIVLVLMAALADDIVVNSDVVFSFTSCLLLVLFISGGVYKCKAFEYVFVFLLLNIGALNFFIVNNGTATPRHNISSIVLLSSVVLVACGIVVYHIYLRLKPMRGKAVSKMPQVLLKRLARSSEYATIDNNEGDTGYVSSSVFSTSVHAETCKRDPIIFDDTTEY